MSDNYSYRSVLGNTLEHALQHLDNLDSTPVAAKASLETLRQKLCKPLNDGGLPAEQVINELVSDSSGGIMGCAGGRFYGWVIGGLYLLRWPRTG